MRIGRSLQTGRGQAPMVLFGPNNIFARKLASNAALATDQTPALQMANQMNYANTNYSFDGSPAPSFYGYSGLGYGGWPAGFQTNLSYTSFTIAFYVVDSSVPNQKVTFVNFSDATHWTTQPNGAHQNLQAGFNAVPVPDVTKIPQGQIWPNGTDRHVCIWRPSTNEYWEMWRFYDSSLYPSPPAPTTGYVFGNGAYTNSANTFNGIWPFSWGARATSLAASGGLITQQDIIDVLNGLPIRHSIGVALEVIANVAVPPTTRNDTHSSTPQFQADGTTPNPAFGYVDAVGEGTWCRFPASFNPASAMPGAGPIALAIATAIRDYGLFVMDGSGSISFNLEDPRVLGSPYSYAKVNAFAGSTGLAAGWYDSYINNNVPSTWTDSSLAKVTEVTNGLNSVFSQIPWQQLQVLQPFSS